MATASIKFITTAFLFVIFTTVISCFTITIPLYHKNHPIFHPNKIYEDAPRQGEVTLSGGGEFVVHLYVGTPPWKTYAVFDTGSPIFWLQTAKCNEKGGRCMLQPRETIYDFEKSSTIELLTCIDRACQSLKIPDSHHQCNPMDEDSQCTYDLDYMDNSGSFGYVATDLVSFADGSTPVRLMVGLGINNRGAGHIERMANPGVFGLSMGAMSQLEERLNISMFAYCIPADTTESGYVTFGSAAEFVGQWAYFKPNVTEYTLSLTSISFNGKHLYPYEGSWEGYSMTLDTGCPVTFMQPDVLKPLKVELTNLFGQYESHPSLNYDICWKGMSADDEVIKNMTITFHFNGIDLNLYHIHLWKEIPVEINRTTLFCFYMYEAPPNFLPDPKESMLGTFQTTNKYIATNYVDHRIAIEDRQC